MIGTDGERERERERERESRKTVQSARLDDDTGDDDDDIILNSSSLDVSKTMIQKSVYLYVHHLRKQNLNGSIKMNEKFLFLHDLIGKLCDLNNKVK